MFSVVCGIEKKTVRKESGTEMPFFSKLFYISQAQSVIFMKLDYKAEALLNYH